MQQADDLLAEGKDFYAFLKTLNEEDWSKPTPFKGWTPHDVVGHLHMGDWLAVLSMTDEPAFDALLEKRRSTSEQQQREAEELSPALAAGSAICDQWWGYFERLCAELAERDPKGRVKWVGPSMSVRMCATARQMETWAHAQDIYDMLHAPRVHFDRIRNIAELGVRTFGWTFANRKMQPPGPAPAVRITAPSGELWSWDGEDGSSFVEGSALEFCQVVTQGRNIGDVNLTVVGDTAQQWMAIAQCFAGDPKDPPAPGERAWA